MKTRLVSNPVIERKRCRGTLISERSMTRTYHMSRDEDLDDVLDREFGENAVVAKTGDDTIGYIIKPEGEWCRVSRAS